VNGIPVFDGTVVEAMIGDAGRGEESRVLVGVGPAGGRPRAYLLLCPCEGVQGLVRDLQSASAVASIDHGPHDDPDPGSWRAST
jgi:hypothetical protein